jgi:hypothetical protein
VCKIKSLDYLDLTRCLGGISFVTPSEINRESCTYLQFSWEEVGSVQYVFNHVVIKIWQLFLQPAACLTSTLLKIGEVAND